MTKNQERQAIIRLYKEQTGEKEVDMHKVVDFAVKRLGMPLPVPVDPLDQLATQFSHAAREETRKDKKTGRIYRVNHAVPHFQQGKQMYLWVDIDEAPREPMRRSLMNRREQIVGDNLQLSLDADHWNDIHPDEQQIELPLDYTDDVEWRKNAPEDKSA